MLHLDYGFEWSWKLDPSQIDQKCLGSYEMFWRRMEKISWSDRVKNEILHRVKEDRNILHKKRRKDNWIGHILRNNCLQTTCTLKSVVFVCHCWQSSYCKAWDHSLATIPLCHPAILPRCVRCYLLSPNCLAIRLIALNGMLTNLEGCGRMQRGRREEYKEDPQSGHQSLLWYLLCSKHGFWSVFCSIQ